MSANSCFGNLPTEVGYVIFIEYLVDLLCYYGRFLPVFSSNSSQVWSLNG